MPTKQQPRGGNTKQEFPEVHMILVINLKPIKDFVFQLQHLQNVFNESNNMAFQQLRSGKHVNGPIENVK